MMKISNIRYFRLTNPHFGSLMTHENEDNFGYHKVSDVNIYFVSHTKLSDRSRFNSVLAIFCLAIFEENRFFRQYLESLFLCNGCESLRNHWPTLSRYRKALVLLNRHMRRNLSLALKHNKHFC